MKCPNCQKEIPANSKFCTFCGFQIPQVAAATAQTTPVTPQPQAQPQFNANQAQYSAQSNATQSETPNQTKEMAKNYWSYLVHGMKHPSDIDTPFNKNFGIISLLLGSLFIALTVLMIGLHATSAFGSYSGTAGGVSFGAFFGVLIFSIIGSFFTYSMTHLVTRGFLGDKSADYMEDMTRYYHISSLGLMAAAVGFVFSILGAFMTPFIAICYTLFFIMNSISYVALVFRAHPTNNFDRVYAYLTGLIVIGIVGAIFWTLLAGIGLASVFSGILPFLNN